MPELDRFNGGGGDIGHGSDGVTGGNWPSSPVLAHREHHYHSLSGSFSSSSSTASSCFADNKQSDQQDAVDDHDQGVGRVSDKMAGLGEGWEGGKSAERNANLLGAVVIHRQDVGGGGGDGGSGVRDGGEECPVVVGQGSGKRKGSRGFALDGESMR